MNVLPRSTVALALSALGLAAARPGRFCVITGHSMSPTLHHGQVVWVEAIDPRQPELYRGEVVLFRWRARTYVKRVYATAGERVLLLADVGDSQPLLTPVRPDAEACVARAVRRYGRYRFQHLRVPPGTFYALGDCFANSIDSRSLGPIPVRAVLGRVRPLVGRLPDFDAAIGPVRRQHVARSTRHAAWDEAGRLAAIPLRATCRRDPASLCARRGRVLRGRRSAGGTPPTRRRAPSRLPR